MYARWPCPNPPGGGDEVALAFDYGRSHRVMVLMPVFDESSKFRRQVVETMRLLDRAGIDSILPDLPGCNESLAPFPAQTLLGWRDAAATAARHFAATHVLAIRSGGWFAPPAMSGWLYAPVRPPQALRAMLRARVLAAREAGREERAEILLEQGRAGGLVLGGWPLGPALIAELEQEMPENALTAIAPDALPGRPLWLRAEPDFDAAQAEALAAIVARGLAG